MFFSLLPSIADGCLPEDLHRCNTLANYVNPLALVFVINPNILLLPKISCFIHGHWYFWFYHGGLGGLGSKKGKKETLEFDYPLNFQQEIWLLTVRKDKQIATKARTLSSTPSSDAPH